jgi:hypothetical protein
MTTDTYDPNESRVNNGSEHRGLPGVLNIDAIKLARVQPPSFSTAALKASG